VVLVVMAPVAGSLASRLSRAIVQARPLAELTGLAVTRVSA